MALGFDIVIHNECWANEDLPAQVVQNITSAAGPARRGGGPARGAAPDAR